MGILTNNQRSTLAKVLAAFSFLLMLWLFAGTTRAAEYSDRASEVSASSSEAEPLTEKEIPVDRALQVAEQKQTELDCASEAAKKEDNSDPDGSEASENADASENEEDSEKSEEPQSIVGYVQTGILNVRSKPNGNAQIVATLSAGKQIDIYYQYGNWYGIACGKVKGWVSAEYVHAGELNIDATTVIATAKKYIGCPYVWGGTSPDGFDCSGFVQYVFAKQGLYLERCADDQYYQGTPVANKDIRPGDLVVFGYSLSDITHVGIYIGKGYFIHCSNGGVNITSLFGDYYRDMYLGAARVIPS